MNSTGNLQKNQFGPEQIRELIANWRQSGKTKKRFADEHGLKYYTFVEWCRRFNDVEPGVGFREIKMARTVRASAWGDSGEQVFAEIQKGPMVIRFFRPFPLEYFQSLIR